MFFCRQNRIFLKKKRFFFKKNFIFSSDEVLLYTNGRMMSGKTSEGFTYKTSKLNLANLVDTPERDVS